MTNHIKAVFEHGIFRPVERVSLEEGTPVEISFEQAADFKPPQLLLNAIEEIAKMPLESPQDGFSGADHDVILYGAEGAW